MGLKLAFEGTPSLMATDGDELSIGSTGNEPCNHFGIPTVAEVTPANGSAATTVAGSATIDTSNYWTRITNAGAITGIILEAGVKNGQKFLLTVDKDAVGSVTFAAAGTSNVGGGTGVVITAGSSREFIWDATDACWSQLGET